MPDELAHLIWHETPLLLGRFSLLIIALLIVGLILGPAIDRLARRRRHQMHLPEHHPLVEPDRKDHRP